MPKSLRGFLRLLAVAAFIATFMPLYPEADPGREFPRCIQQCNEIRKACGERCAGDCADLFPQGTTQYDQCVSNCKNEICVTQSQDCKLACQAVKGPPTNEEP